MGRLEKLEQDTFGPGVANIAFGIHESNHYSSRENTGQTERNVVSFFCRSRKQTQNYKHVYVCFITAFFNARECSGFQNHL